MKTQTIVLFIFVCTIYIIHIILYKQKKQNNMEYFKTKYAICLITFQPKQEWIDFLSAFTYYDVYIVVDDDIYILNKTYENITFIKIDNHECRKHGFVNMNFFIGKEISGWDKAMYYFSSINTQYSRVWFLEDDVFIHNESTLINIDERYGSSCDLISPNIMGDHTSPWPHWPLVHIELPLPYYFGMVCACRISNTLLQIIQEYANKNKSLFFLEALFPTLAKHYQLNICTPHELDTVVYKHDYLPVDINKENIYHPVKNINNHIIFRSNRIDY